MKIITSVFIIYLFGFLACTSEGVNNEIASLNTHDKKEHFLLNLFKSDQSHRVTQGDTAIKYGYLSKKHIAFLKDGVKQDSINFEKAIFYSETFNYPSCNEFSELACLSMLYVVGHRGSFEDQKSVFNYFHVAYIENKIDEDKFLFLLDEMYERKYRILYDFKNKYTVKERIEILIEILELD